MASTSPENSLQYDLSELAVQPARAPPLLPHQLAALHRMVQFESCHSRAYTPVAGSPGAGAEPVTVRSDFGVYLERSGAGKSYTLLGLIASAHSIAAKPHIVQSVCNESYSFSLSRAPAAHAPEAEAMSGVTLLVCKPGEHFRQWCDLLHTYASPLRCKPVATTNACRALLAPGGVLADLPRGQPASGAARHVVDLVLITHTMLRTMRRLMVSGFIADGGQFVEPHNVAWKRIVVDDAHRVMVPADLRSGFTWFVTNSAEDLHASHGMAGRIDGADALATCIFRSHVSPEVGRFMTVTGLAAVVDAAFAGSPVTAHHIVCKAPASIATHICIPNVHALLEAGKSAAVAQHLGIDTVGDDQLLAALVRPYRGIISSVATTMTDQQHRPLLTDSGPAYTRCLNHIRQRITWLTNNVSEQADCLVCYDPMPTRVVLKCGHQFCPTCIFKWWFRDAVPNRGTAIEKIIVCPVCKDSCASTEMFFVDPSVRLHPPLNKLDTVADIIRTRVAGDHKVAVFGNTSDCSLLNTLLYAFNIYAVNAFGGKPPAVISAFRPADSSQYRRVLIASTNYECYAGLNLSAIDTVILLSPDFEAPAVVDRILGCVRNCAVGLPLDVYNMYNIGDAPGHRALRVWSAEEEATPEAMDAAA
jgi:hypothetical protein